MKASRAVQEKLLALQQLDSDLLQIKHKSITLPVAKLFEEVSKELAGKRALLVAAKTERDDIKHELSRAEIDVEQVVSRIERDEKRLSSGQGAPKELEQLQHELGSLAKRRAELEEVELEIMVRIESVDMRIKELESNCKELESQQSELAVRKQGELSDLDLTAKKTSEARSTLVPSIDADLFSLYEKIRLSADGIGAAKLSGNQCLGCNLTLNAADLARIKALADDEVVRCEECRRILIRLD